MNETDIKKCIKHGYAWSSCGDKPEKTPTKDYARAQMATYEGLHATKREAALSIATSREEVRVAARKEAGTQVTHSDMPDELMLNGKLHKRLAEGARRKVCDVLVDGSQTNRFGSVYYRPVEETPAQRDVRIKALVEGYKAKGGKITKEQLTEEVKEWSKRNDICYWDYSRGFVPYALHTTIGIPWPKIARDSLYWKRADAEHDKMMDDGQTQMTPITPEQKKMLRNVDQVFAVNCQRLIETCKVGSMKLYSNHTYYFTRPAAQAALDKQKSDADPEPPMWCERKKGEDARETDSYTWSASVNINIKSALYSDASASNTWVYPTHKANSSVGIKVGTRADDGSILRARYHNPAHREWKNRQVAKHVNKVEMKPTVTPVEQPSCSSSSEMSEETITPTESNITFGNKYHRTIKGVTEGSAVVDVYCVLEAFAVTCPARQHAIKKLLCAGLRGKGDTIQDLAEAMESVSRAIVLEKQRKA